MKETGICIKPPLHQSSTIIKENDYPTLVTQSCVAEKQFPLTVDAEAYVTVARPGIATG
jgi:hypothetical protein